MPSGQMPQYAVTESMLLSLSKSISKLTRGTEVTVNMIMPGPTTKNLAQSEIQRSFRGSPIRWMGTISIDRVIIFNL